ncbi:hypothetical protein QD712_24715 [Streptomyces acidiscabies]|uniref:hypothetical protein n=1 Tax=Streptomyces acidiscabies TaxID=42234 RepID=UPI0030CB4CBD
MNRETLLADGPPARTEEDCCHCGRRTLVPIPCTRRDDVYACPDCLLIASHRT